MIRSENTLPSSFRDPSGFVFSHQGEVYRQVNINYRDHYCRLMESGLYDSLVAESLLLPHEQSSVAPPLPDCAHTVIKPTQIPFISYPYEWCFSQLKTAALATLDIQDKALAHGMVLKDASAYNIQFLGGRPVFIDTLSFEEYKEGEPWVAYRQFCQHFLAPIALMARADIRLNQLARIYIDGIPLSLASNLLPFFSRFTLSLFLHIHAHAKSQARYAESGNNTARAGKRKIRRNVSRIGLRGLVDNLRSAIRKLCWKPEGTEWGDYYHDTNYTIAAMDEKKRLVAEFLDLAAPKMVWDIGANTGEFSRIASGKGMQTISFDIDPAAVERNFLQTVQEKESHLLPLLLDATNPSPSLGWQNRERNSMLERGPADTVLALALIHHLVISNNVPLPLAASFFYKIARTLIIEFVPKSDSQVKRLLASREDIFPDYTQDGFEQAFLEKFQLGKKYKLAGSERILYFFKKK